MYYFVPDYLINSSRSFLGLLSGTHKNLTSNRELQHLIATDLQIPIKLVLLCNTKQQNTNSYYVYTCSSINSRRVSSSVVVKLMPGYSRSPNKEQIDDGTPSSAQRRNRNHCRESKSSRLQHWFRRDHRLHAKISFRWVQQTQDCCGSNMAVLWGIILGQCTGSLQQHIKAEDDYDQHLYDAYGFSKPLRRWLPELLINQTCTI